LTTSDRGANEERFFLDLILTNKERCIGDVKAKSSLGCSDHEMGLEDSERREQDKKQDHKQDQKSRLWHLQRSA